MSSSKRPKQPPIPFVLASFSERRRRILLDAGYAFEAHDPGEAEDAVAAAPGPEALAMAKARAKAQAIAAQLPASKQHLVLGADTLVALGDEVLGKPLDRIYTTMAHELEHLLNYASKVYKAKLDGGQGAIESLWLDEGLAHFAEDACGYGGENVTLLSQELFTSFGDTRMFETDSANDKLTMRAMAMTFLRYMFERKGGVTYNSDGTIADKGGAAWLQSLVTSDKQGTDNVTASYGDYKDAMNNWIAAIVLDGRSVTDYVGFNYDPLVTDPVTGNSIGMIVRGTRKDNTGADVNLQGPLENNFSGPSVDETIPNSSAKFFKLSGQTGKVKISVTTQESDFRFAVIKIK